MSDHMDWFSKKEWQNQLTMTSSYLLLRLNLYPRISHAEKESVSVSASAAPCSSVSCSSSDSGSTCLISSQVLKRSRGTLRCINVEMTLSKFLSLPYEAPMMASTISARSYRNGNVRFGYRKIEKKHLPYLPVSSFLDHRYLFAQPSWAQSAPVTALAPNLVVPTLSL